MLPEELVFLEFLSNLIDYQIPHLTESRYKFGSEIRRRYSFGYTIKNNRIYYLGLESVFSESLPEDNVDLLYSESILIPESIEQLTLCLQFNQLPTLPKSIENLSSLQKLYLSGNVLSALPESIGNLSNLQELKLDDNQLSMLPESIGQLTNLQTLNIIHNINSSVVSIAQQNSK